MLKKTMALTLITVMAFVALPKPTAYAGDKEWATAGKILAGVVGAAIIHEVVTSRGNDRVVYVRRTYGQPVRRVRRVQSPRRTWVPGHYEVRIERQWVEGWWEKAWIPAEYKRIRVTHYDARGRARTTWKKVLVSEGHYERVWHEGYWETSEVRDWIPGHWEYH